MATLTAKQTRDVRKHMRAAGLDPFDMSQRAFMQYAEKHGFDKPGYSRKPPASIAPKPAPVTPKPAPVTPEIVTAPETAPAAPANDVGAAVSAAIATALAQFTAPADISPDQIEEAVKKYCTRTLTIEQPGQPTKTIAGAHEQLGDIITILEAGVHPYIWGEAGSGKTHMAQQVADHFELSLYLTGKVDEVFDLTGFKDATGVYQETDFYRWCLNGGVFLFDEGDGSLPQSLTRFNAAVSNGYMDFPCGLVKLHPDCKVIMAANTNGNGATYRYQRNRLDQATMDRFAVVEVKYDLALERSLALNAWSHPDCDAWVDFVQATRVQADAIESPLLISPRASINGAKLLRAGLDLDKVKNMVIWKGASVDVINSLVLEG